MIDTGKDTHLHMRLSSLEKQMVVNVSDRNDLSMTDQTTSLYRKEQVRLDKRDERRKGKK